MYLGAKIRFSCKSSNFQGGYLNWPCWISGLFARKFGRKSVGFVQKIGRKSVSFARKIGGKSVGFLVSSVGKM